MKAASVKTSDGRVLPTAASFVPFAKNDIEQSIGRRFEQQVERWPQKVAVRTTTQGLTYTELNRWANHVAQGVLAAVGEENDPVAILVGSDALAIAAIIGLLKAGKIYVPLDPADSVARQNAILDESRAKLVLTDGTADGLAAPGRRLLDLNALDRAAPVDNPALSIAPAAAAYIFYTSGSTGQPKGVFDSHRNVLHNVMRYTNSLRISPEDRLTLLQSFSFSGSVSSLLCALLNGATSYPFDLRREGSTRLVAWLADEGITMYHSVPSIFRLIATGDREFPALRIIRLEGDRARPGDIELFKRRFADGCMLVNGLGATECGLVRQFFVDKTTPTPEDIVPIGAPVQDMTIRLLDDAGEQVGPGTIGEIAVESEFLATGYWRRADLTDAAFRPHPNDPRKRIYRTGDLGRMQPDGCLDYLDRKHFQIKVRGLWVDTAAVERMLLEFGQFKDAIVHVRDEHDTEPVLVAYLVPIAKPPAPSAIRRYLDGRLPGHMVPAAFVFLDGLPLDQNGKIDRKSLLLTGCVARLSDRTFAPPQSMLQLQLQRIWQAVLQVPSVGVRDDFFELGGDSLAALNMLMTVERATERTIPPEVLLAGPTIEKLAKYIGTQANGSARAIVEIQKGGPRRPFYYLHGDYESGGLYILRIARELGADRPFYALPPCGRNGHAAPESYARMATIHLAALRAHQPRGPYLLGGTCNGGLAAYEMARQLVAAGETVDLLVLIGSSARNLRFRSLRRLLSPMRTALPNGAAFERRLSGGIARLIQLWAKLQSLPARQYPQYMRSRIPMGSDLVRYVFKGGGANGASLYPLYQRIDQEYMPGTYAGKVTLLCSGGETEPIPESVRWWRMVAADVDVHMLPAATHQEALTAHPEIVAALLKSCLDAADARCHS